MVDGQLAYGPIGAPQPLPDGMLTSTCSQEREPESIEPGSDLGRLVVVPAGASSEDCAPLWTGDGCLTAFAGSHGLVVVLLEEGDIVVSEQIFSHQSSESVRARCSKNGDRALLVFERTIRIGSFTECST